MFFDNAIVKGVRADLHKGVILLTFAVGMEDQAAAEQLAGYIGKNGGGLELTVSSRQMNFAALRTWKTETAPGVAVAGETAAPLRGEFHPVDGLPEYEDEQEQDQE